MLNRVINGEDILVHAKPLAIKAHYTKWKALSQLERLRRTDFLESDEKVRQFSHFAACRERRLRRDPSRSTAPQGLPAGSVGQVVSQASGRIGRDAGRSMIRCANREFPMRNIYAPEGTKSAAGWKRIVLPLKIAFNNR